mmetsp:Transcript_100113/g.150073  ORF Transcript_100113/g.150073 Transcript_100113/m.150073 type:complete len:137 (-) Transcript_100113:149-559(-)|eukprot:CAMPEP_0117031504 /NCGR_PEP_ID=MMETSP0472-20121206/22634_1 /TAXON_ID=693140 ORGANISM="Tiarina fusus, Strain LIS" /NCGR_SAMPLE_ID=MMETSP0472 /ASSEMBLY_ACC=CAM_ASM_000603 /LENGTH=136 /DNA_ID=CAMNT_0004739839 /DNA_START=113 /DNA_END=523 /DNA_ORIENTATION=+
MTIQQMIPIFRSFDEAKAKEFYVEYLGFEVCFEHRFDDDAPLYFGVVLGNGFEMHLSEHHGDSTPGSSIRIEMDDIEAFHATLTAKKYKNARPGLEQQPWGFREVKVADPFGNNLIFCQPDDSLIEQRKQRETSKK